jgi:hypothetical protein
VDLADSAAAADLAAAVPLADGKPKDFKLIVFIKKAAVISRFLLLVFPFTFLLPTKLFDFISQRKHDIPVQNRILFVAKTSRINGSGRIGVLV